LRLPDAAPIEPYKPEHISTFLKILENEWRASTTSRQKMLAARNRAVLSLFLESLIRLEECSQLNVNDIDLERKRILVRKTKSGKPRIAGFGDQTKKYFKYTYFVELLSGLRPAAKLIIVLFIELSNNQQMGVIN